MPPIADNSVGVLATFSVVPVRYYNTYIHCYGRRLCRRFGYRGDPGGGAGGSNHFQFAGQRPELLRREDPRAAQPSEASGDTREDTQQVLASMAPARR